MTQRNRFALRRRSSSKASRSRTTVYRRFQTAGLEQLELRALLTAGPSSPDSVLLGSDNAWESDSGAMSLRAMLASCSRSSSPATDEAAAPAVSPLATMSYDTSDDPQDAPDNNTADTAAATGDGPEVSPLVGTELARFRLEAQDMSDNVITTIDVGADFQLVAWVNDIRDPAGEIPGVWAAFMDIAYSSSLVSITAQPNDPDPGDNGQFGDFGIEWGGFFDEGLRFGNLDTAGQVTGIGAASLAFSGSGLGEELLFKITVHATAAGTVVFTPSFDSNPDHESSFLDPSDAFTAAQIDFVPLSLEIAGPPIVSITPSVSHNEGNTGTTPSTPYIFDVTLSHAGDLPVQVTYTTSNGSAQAGDFVAQTGTLSFAVGETSKSVTIGVVGDTAIESNETFNVTLSSPIESVLGAASVGVGTIVNDDFPLVSINSVSQNEGNTGTTDFIFTVSLSEAINQQVTVAYTTSNGSTQAADFVAQTATLTFAPNETSKTITIAVVGESLVELDETFNVTLSSPVGSVLGAASVGVGTITNDDVALIGVAAVSQLEGNADNNLVFEVTISTANPTQVLVPYATSDGTALATGGSADFAATSGTLTFAAGSTQSQFVTVTIHGDATIEDNETFRLVLTDPANADFDSTNGEAVATLLDDDGHISITPQNLSQNEGNLGQTEFVFTVNIGTATDVPVTVQYATANGTASSGSDYTAKSGTLTFAPDGPTTQNITVLVNGDSLFEANETFSLILSNPTSATIIQGTATGTIDNDDVAPSISFLANAVSLTEGNAGNGSMVFTVQLSEASGQNVTVNYATTNGTASSASDYAATSGTLTFLPTGSLAQDITVSVTGDLVDEVDETFTLDLTNPVGATLASPVNDKVTATGTIVDNDIAPTMNIDSVTHDETNSGQINYIFTVTLSAASGQTIVVPFTTENGTAQAGTDYIAASGSITFLPGQISRTITVQASGDTLNEVNETFKLNLTAPANVTAGTIVGTGTITNDDPLPQVRISNSQPKAEGNSGTTEFFFEIQLVNASGQETASGQEVAVSFSTANGTADVTNDDYIGQSGRITFAPGTTSKLITVLANGDTRNEADETFTVFLTNPQNATLASSQSSGQTTINNDDAVPTISIGDVTKAEGNSGNTAFVFQVTLSALSGKQVTVAFATANGTATVGNADYVATSGTLTFAAGVGIQTVTVQVIGDLFDEADETFQVNLTNPTNATLADAQGIGTIQDEGTDNITFTLSTFAGKMFIDSDQQNDLDAVELGLAGVSVAVTGTSSVTNQAVTRSFTTTATGVYSFADLQPGTYRVTFSQLAGYTKSKVITNGSNSTALPTTDASVGYSFAIPSLGGIQSTNNNVGTIGLQGSNVSQRFFLASKYAADSAAAAALTSDEVSPLTSSSDSDASLRSSLASSLAAEAQVEQVGSVVTVNGTSGDDQFEFVAGDVNTITINGLTRHYDSADVTEFVFNGGGGQDTAQLTGSTGDEVADLGVGSGTLTGANFKVSVSNVGWLSVTGGGGTDAATLHDSALSDHLQAVEDEVTLTDELGVVTQLVAFARVQALSASGGTDTISIVEPLDIALEQQGNWLAV